MHVQGKLPALLLAITEKVFEGWNGGTATLLTKVARTANWVRHEFSRHCLERWREQDALLLENCRPMSSWDNAPLFSVVLASLGQYGQYPSALDCLQSTVLVVWRTRGSLLVFGDSKSLSVPLQSCKERAKKPMGMTSREANHVLSCKRSHLVTKESLVCNQSLSVLPRLGNLI